MRVSVICGDVEKRGIEKQTEKQTETETERDLLCCKSTGSGLFDVIRPQAYCTPADRTLSLLLCASQLVTRAGAGGAIFKVKSPTPKQPPQ